MSAGTELTAGGVRLGLAVIGGHIFTAHRGTNGAVWTPIGLPTAMVADRVVHAVTYESISHSKYRRRRTFDATCGVRAKPTLRADAGDGEVVLAPWPPRVGDLPADASRCRACLIEHGRSLQAWDAWRGDREAA